MMPLATLFYWLSISLGVGSFMMFRGWLAYIADADIIPFRFEGCGQ